MPSWIIVTLIGVVCAAAFVGAVIGVLIAKAVLRRITDRETRRCARTVPPSEAVERVLDLARTLTISVAAMDDDLKGRGARA